MDAAVGLSRDGRADGVGDAHGEGAAGLAVPQGVQGVGGLAGLRDEEADVVPVGQKRQISIGTRQESDLLLVLSLWCELAYD